MENSELLNVVETASLMRLSQSTIRSWILKRKLPYVKLGGRVFVRRSDCYRLIKASLVPEEHRISKRRTGTLNAK